MMLIEMITLLLYTMPFWMAAITRIHGGWLSLSYGRTISTILFGLPFYFLAIHKGLHFEIALICATFAILGLAIGVVDGFPGQTRSSQISPFVLAISKLFNSSQDSTLYNALYFMTKAAIIVLPSVFKAPLLLIAIPLYALLYWISFKVSNHSVYAEILTGSIIGDLILLSW